uniref:Uncharacterized protein n=1 Tax=Octopus bimaculoides TaxID=37653 RepID=A0A0L8HPL4_OCTBM
MSLVNYHSDFEKQKGCYTMVAEPMDIKQHLENTKNISLIQYHSDFEKQKGNVTPVADTLEMKRHTENAKNISLMHYRSDFTKLKGTATQVTVESLEMKRHAENAKNLSAHLMIGIICENRQTLTYLIVLKVITCWSQFNEVHTVIRMFKDLSPVDKLTVLEYLPTILNADT